MEELYKFSLTKLKNIVIFRQENGLKNQANMAYQVYVRKGGRLTFAGIFKGYRK